MASSTQLAPMDAIPLYLETPRTNGNVCAVFRLAGPVSYSNYADSMTSDRLDQLPRFRQTVSLSAWSVKPPVWRDAPDFTLNDHLHHIQLNPAGASDELHALIDRMITMRFDFRTPPWQLYVVNGLEDGGSAVILRFHHCLSDGMGLVNRVFPVLLDGLPQLHRKEPETTSPGFRPSGPETGSLVAGAEEHDHFGRIMHAFASAPGVPLPFRRTLSGRAHHAALSFDMEDLRAMRSRLGGTTNDVLLTVLAGAVDRLASRLGLERKGRFCRIIQPADVRRDDERHEEGNYLSFLPALLPLGLDGKHGLREMHRHIVAYKEELRTAGMRSAGDTFLRTMPSRLPPPLLRLAFRLLNSRLLQRFGSAIMPMPSVDLYCSHVRWTDKQASISDASVTGLTVLAPLMLNTGLSCVAMTHDRRLHVGLTADAVTFPEVDTFATDMLSAFDALRALAQVKTSESVE